MVKSQIQFWKHMEEDSLWIIPFRGNITSLKKKERKRKGHFAQILASLTKKKFKYLNFPVKNSVFIFLERLLILRGPNSHKFGTIYLTDLRPWRIVLALYFLQLLDSEPKLQLINST